MNLKLFRILSLAQYLCCPCPLQQGSCRFVSKWDYWISCQSSRMEAWSQIWFALIKTNKQKKTKKKWYFPYIQIHSCKFTPATEVWEIYTTLFNKTEWKSYSFCFTTYTFPYSKAKCSSVTSSFVFAVFFSFFLLSDELNLSESHDMCISSLWHGFNWSIVVLYFVSFCCTAKWISHMYKYHPLFFGLLHDTFLALLSRVIYFCF